MLHVKHELVTFLLCDVMCRFMAREDSRSNWGVCHHVLLFLHVSSLVVSPRLWLWDQLFKFQFHVLSDVILSARHDSDT